MNPAMRIVDGAPSGLVTLGWHGLPDVTPTIRRHPSPVPLSGPHSGGQSGLEGCMARQAICICVGAWTWLWVSR